jgi:TatD DNase family protein
VGNPRLIDSHCHLTNGKLANHLAEVLAQSRDVGVVAVLTAGTSVLDSTAALGMARRNEGVVFSVGVHPHEAKDVAADYLQQLKGLAATGGALCVAVGEIGLDYHYDFSPREAQRRVFTEQMDLAVELGKPVIVHTREAAADTLATLAPYAGRLRGVLHSFTGDATEVRAFLDQGWHIGFAGIVTFKNADANRDAAKLVPLDRLLVETDAPYLSPVPVRKVFPNTPAHVVHTARFLADLRGEPFEAFAGETTANAVDLFGLDIPGR